MTPHTRPKHTVDETRAFFRLSLQLAVADFNLRNEGSYLGNIWYLLNPLLLFVILYLIFFDRLGQEIPSYSAYLMTGILLFTFFVRTTTDATGAIARNNVIKSIRFERDVLVFSVIVKNLLSHAFEAVTFFSILLFLGVPWYGIFLYVPVLFLLALFTYGVSLFLASVTVYIADLGNVWNFFTTLLLFGTPIFYAVGGQARLFLFNLGNPLYYFITAVRESIVYGQLPDIWIIAGILVFPLISLAIGMFVFRQLEHTFPEMI